MYSFQELLKHIRSEAGLTQADLAKALEVSPVLIAMIESGQREVSKKFIDKLASKLYVHPASITPFLYSSSSSDDLSAIEKQFFAFGVKLQKHLIKNRARLLRDEK